MNGPVPAGSGIYVTQALEARIGRVLPARLRRRFDGVHHGVEAVRIVPHCHLEGRGEGAHFLVARDTASCTEQTQSKYYGRVCRHPSTTDAGDVRAWVTLREFGQPAGSGKAEYRWRSTSAPTGTRAPERTADANVIRPSLRSASATQ